MLGKAKKHFVELRGANEQILEYGSVAAGRPKNPAADKNVPATPVGPAADAAEGAPDDATVAVKTPTKPTPKKRSRAVKKKNNDEDDAAAAVNGDATEEADDTGNAPIPKKARKSPVKKAKKAKDATPENEAGAPGAVEPTTPVVANKPAAKKPAKAKTPGKGKKAPNATPAALVETTPATEASTILGNDVSAGEALAEMSNFA